MGRYTTLLELKRTSPPLEGELSVRPQRYTTNPIKVEGVASRHRSPYTFPQAPAEEHGPTQSSDKLLYSKIAPLKRTYKKPVARRLKTNQYWSPIGAVLVAPSTSTGYYH